MSVMAKMFTVLVPAFGRSRICRCPWSAECQSGNRELPRWLPEFRQQRSEVSCRQGRTPARRRREERRTCTGRGSWPRWRDTWRHWMTRQWWRRRSFRLKILQQGIFAKMPSILGNDPSIKRSALFLSILQTNYVRNYLLSFHWARPARPALGINMLRPCLIYYVYYVLTNKSAVKRT